MARYKCIITSDWSLGREYDTDTSSALRAAEQYGRCEGGERVTVYTRRGKPVSAAAWTPEDGGHYYRTYLPED